MLRIVRNAGATVERDGGEAEAACAAADDFASHLDAVRRQPARPSSTTASRSRSGAIRDADGIDAERAAGGVGATPTSRTPQQGPGTLPRGCPRRSCTAAITIRARSTRRRGLFLRATDPFSHMESLLPWIVALAASPCWPRCGSGACAPRAPQPQPLPAEWGLAARPVFRPTSGASIASCAKRCRITSCCRSCRWCASASRPTRARCATGTNCSARSTSRSRVQRQWPRAGRDRPRHRPRQLAPRAADQAVGARRLPRALPALPGGQPAVDRRVAVAGAPGRRRIARPAAGAPSRPSVREARDQLASTPPRAGANARRCGRTRRSSRTRSSRPTTASTPASRAANCRRSSRRASNAWPPRVSRPVGPRAHAQP